MVGWGWALIRGWALIKFFCLQDGRLFELGANSRLGAYSNKYGNQHFQVIEFLDQPVPEKLDMGFLFYGQEMLQVECKVDCKTVRFCVFKKCKYARRSQIKGLERG